MMTTAGLPTMTPDSVLRSSQRGRVPPPLFSATVHEGVDFVADDVGVDEGEEGELAAEDVPATEDGALGVVFGAVGFFVCAEEVAVDVLEGAGVEQGVVEGGVEDGAVFFGAAFDLDFGEFGGPGLAGGGAGFFEVEVGEFGF